MLKRTRLSLFALAVFVNPVMAGCNLLLADIEALTTCAQTQGYTIQAQASEIALLRKEVDYLKEFQNLHQKAIEKLSDRLFELRLEVELQKAKPSK